MVQESSFDLVALSLLSFFLFGTMFGLWYEQSFWAVDYLKSATEEPKMPKTLDAIRDQFANIFAKEIADKSPELGAAAQEFFKAGYDAAVMIVDANRNLLNEDTNDKTGR